MLDNAADFLENHYRNAVDERALTVWVTRDRDHEETYSTMITSLARSGTSLGRAAEPWVTQ
jgi:hypothetical protein